MGHTLPPEDLTTTELLVSARRPRSGDEHRRRSERVRAVAEEYLRRRQRKVRARNQARQRTRS